MWLTSQEKINMNSDDNEEIWNYIEREEDQLPDSLNGGMGVGVVLADGDDRVSNMDKSKTSIEYLPV